MKKRIAIMLLFVISLGVFLRVYQLDKEGLTLDEVLTAEKSATGLPHLVKYWTSQDHFPTYFIFLHYWMQLFGESEIALRFPSAICGILAIYCMFLLGKRLFDEEAGLFASFLFAVSIINIFHSQWARPYSAAVLFTLFSFLSLLEALEKGGKAKWLGYMLLTFFALLLSISVFPILPCQFLFAILLRQKRRENIPLEKIVTIFCIILLIYLPLLLLVVVNPALKTSLNSESTLSFFSFVNIFNHFGGKIYYIKSCGFSLENNPFVDFLTNAFGILLFSLCLIGLVSLIRAKEKRIAHTNGPEATARILLPLWLALPFFVVLPAAFVYSKDPLFGSVRYLLYVSCPYYLLIGKGIISFKKNIRIFLCVLIIITNSVFLYQYYHLEKWTDWRKICAYIKNNIREDENASFIMNNFRPVSFVEHAMLMHYAVPSVIGIKASDLYAGMPGKERLVYEKEVSLLKGHDITALSCSGIWLVNCTASPEAIHKLEEKFILLEKIEIQGVNIYHFRIAR